MGATQECFDEMYGEIVKIIMDGNWSMAGGLVEGLVSYMNESGTVATESQIQRLRVLHEICASSLQGFQEARKQIASGFGGASALEVYDAQGQRSHKEVSEHVKKKY